jgi:tetratricopeptide (TPR) repeat protein
MIWEFIALALAAFMVYRALMLLQPRGSHRTVGAKPKNPQLDTALSYAERLFGENKYIASEKAYLAVLKLDHKNVSAYSHLGRIYVALKNMPEAIESYQSAAQLEPSAHNYFALGSAYYENKNYIKAIAAFEKSIMFEPAAGRYIGLSRSYYRLANAKKAITAMEKAVQLESDEKSWQLLGELYVYDHNAAKAREAFEKTLKINPTNPQALKAMARLPKTVEKASV